MKTRRALVTGATGHLGSVLAAALVASGVEVTALVRPSSTRTGLRGLDLRVFEGDVLDERAFIEAAAGCDVVFHNAAVFEIHTREPEALHRVAVEGARNAVHAAANAKAKLIFTSSVAAVGFGKGPTDVLDEDAWADNLTVPYYRAKQEGEHAAIDAANALGVDLVRVLPTLVLGPGDHRITPSSRLLVDMLEGKGATFEGGGNVIDVRDAARAMIVAAERGRPGSRYILGGENILVRELGAAVSRVTNRKIPHIGLPRWAMSALAGGMELASAFGGGTPALTRAVVRDVFGRYAWYDVKRARADLDLTARPLTDTIRDAAEFFSAQQGSRSH